MAKETLQDAISKQFSKPEFAALTSSLKTYGDHSRQFNGIIETFKMDHEGRPPDEDEMAEIEAQYRKNYGIADPLADKSLLEKATQILQGLLDDSSLKISVLSAKNEVSFKITTQNDKFSSDNDDATVIFRRSLITPSNAEAFTDLKRAKKTSLPLITDNTYYRPEVNSHRDDPDFHYVLMPFVKNGNLETVTIDEAGRIPPQERFDKIRQRGIEIADMVTTMLDNDVCFTDLKPSNLLLDKNDRSKKEHFVIADEKSFFPLALAKPHKKDGKIIFDKFPDSVVLSQNYTPDQMGNNSKNIDIEAYHVKILGKILYECATGQFETEMERMPEAMSNPFFDTKLGNVAKDMIEGSITSVSDAKSKLKKIKADDLLKNYNNETVDVKFKDVETVQVTPMRPRSGSLRAIREIKSKVISRRSTGTTPNPDEGLPSPAIEASQASAPDSDPLPRRAGSRTASIRVMKQDFKSTPGPYQQTQPSRAVLFSSADNREVADSTASKRGALSKLGSSVRSLTQSKRSLKEQSITSNSALGTTQPRSSSCLSQSTMELDTSSLSTTQPRSSSHLSQSTRNMLTDSSSDEKQDDNKQSSISPSFGKR